MDDGAMKYKHLTDEQRRWCAPITREFANTADPGAILGINASLKNLGEALNESRLLRTKLRAEIDDLEAEIDDAAVSLEEEDGEKFERMFRADELKQKLRESEVMAIEGHTALRKAEKENEKLRQVLMTNAVDVMGDHPHVREALIHELQQELDAAKESCESALGMRDELRDIAASLLSDAHELLATAEYEDIGGMRAAYSRIAAACDSLKATR